MSNFRNKLVGPAIANQGTQNILVNAAQKSHQNKLEKERNQKQNSEQRAQLVYAEFRVVAMIFFFAIILTIFFFVSDTDNNNGKIQPNLF